MLNIWLNSIISVAVVSLISLVGILFLAMSPIKLKKILLFLVSLAAGSLLGGAFIHLLPKAVEENGFSLTVSLSFLTGVVLFFVLEKFICWRHCHIPTSKDHPHPLGLMNLVGDGFHNFIDGMVIAAAYLVSFPVGLATTLAVVFHEIPQEIGDFGVLLHAGYSKKKALFFNFLSALSAILGVIIVLTLSTTSESLPGILLPFTAGGFVYIASADLIPELKKETNFKKSSFQLLGLLLGIGVMMVMLLFE